MKNNNDIPMVIEKGNQLPSFDLQYLLDNICNKEYLRELSETEVIPFDAKFEEGITWYKISKITYEKDTFFTDKLSMIYTALHQTAQSIYIVVSKESNELINLYIGTRSNDKDFLSGGVLKNGLEGCLPGIKLSSIPHLNLIENSNNTTNDISISSVSGVGSFRDDKKKKFVQGIDMLINATCAIPQYTVLFIAESVSAKEQSEIRSAYENIYTQLAPLSEYQSTYSRAESQTVTDTLTDNISKTIGFNISRTTTESKSISQTRTEGKGHIKGKWFNGIKSVISNVYRLEGLNSINESIAKAHSKSKSSAISEARNESETIAQSYAIAAALGETITSGEQIKYENKTLKCALDKINKQLERMKLSEGFGLWNTATYFISNSNSTSKKLASIYKGIITGKDSGLEVSAVNAWGKQTESCLEIIRYLKSFTHPVFNFKSVFPVTAGSLINSEELAIHLSLPQTSVPGVIVRKQAVFGRNVVSSSNGANISLGNIVHLDSETMYHVNLNIKDLSMHTFISGSTGSGKSNTIYLLLKHLKNQHKKFLVIESAKGEYKNGFGNMEDENGNREVYVYGTNPRLTPLLRINPFEFPNEIHVHEHIDRLVEIFNACWPMYAAMPAVLRASIENAYIACGWDMLNSLPTKIGLFPTFEDVLEQLRKYIDSSDYSSDTQGDYKGALETRIKSLTTGILGQIFSGNAISDEILYNENVIVDLSRVGSSETKAMIMGMLILKLNEFRMSEKRPMNSPLTHVTILEEAHNLLKRTSTNQQQESSNLVGKSVEMISNSIAEMRTYGEGFIIADQSPSMLDMSAIRNTNTKIIMSLPDKEDRVVAGKAMGLTDEQIEEIAKLKRGHAIVYQNSWEEAVQCHIDKYDSNEKEYNYTSDQQLFSGNIQLFETLIDSYKNDCIVKQSEMYQLILNSSLKSTLKIELLEDLSNEEYTDLEIEELDLHDIQIDKDGCAEILAKIIGEKPMKVLVDNNLDNTKEEFEHNLKQILPEFIPEQVLCLFSNDFNLIYTMYVDGVEQCGFQL